MLVYGIAVWAVVQSGLQNFDEGEARTAITIIQI